MMIGMLMSTSSAFDSVDTDPDTLALVNDQDDLSEEAGLDTEFLD
jgi:hypothetical protein